MSFFFKRKLVRDRIAGLSFCWRGTLGRNTLGVLLAMVVAVFGMGFLFYGVKLQSSGEFKLSKGKVGVVTYIDANHPQIRSKTEFASPFPDRWDPAFDDEVAQRIQALSRVATIRQPYQPMALNEVPVERIDDSLPQVMNSGRFLPALPERKLLGAPKDGVCVLALSTVDAELKARLPQALLKFEAPIDWSMRGEQYPFVVSVSAAGGVLHSTPLNEVKLKGLEQWVRSLRFAKRDSKKGDHVAKIIVQIEGRSP